MKILRYSTIYFPLQVYIYIYSTPKNALFTYTCVFGDSYTNAPHVDHRLGESKLGLPPYIIWMCCVPRNLRRET